MNQPTNYSTTCPTYIRNDNLLTNTVLQCWYVSGDDGRCSVRETLHFSNGQYVNVVAAGDFTVYRPSVSIQNQPEVLHSFILTTNGWWNYPCVGLLQEMTETNFIQHGMSYWVYYDIGEFSGDGELTQLLTADYSGFGGVGNANTAMSR